MEFIILLYYIKEYILEKYLSFVGAGSGDKELITLKGYKRLKNADVVIYTGSLINIELLEYCKDTCEKYTTI